MAIKKKLAVCGCSFMWSSRHNYDAVKGESWDQGFPIIETDFIKNEKESLNYHHWPHFTDIFGEKHNYLVYNFAEGGISNFGIREQINLALSINPDLVVIGATDPNRLEIKNKFDQYAPADITNSSGNFTANRLNAYKSYLAFIHDSNRNAKRDYYMIRSGLHELENKKINYVFLPGPLKEFDWTMHSTVWPSDILQPWDFRSDPHLAKEHLPTGNHYRLTEQHIFLANLEKLEWK